MWFRREPRRAFERPCVGVRVAACPLLSETENFQMSRLHHPAVVLFACLFASQAALLVLSPTLVDIAHEFGVSTATAGQLRSLSGLTGGITAVLLATAPRRP